MNTTNIDILRSFYSVTNRSQLTREIYNLLLKRWDLEGVNLKEEEMRVENKMSKLTKSRREAVKEFIILDEILTEMEQKTKNAEAATQTMNSGDDIIINNNQPLIVGNSL